jgi:uncharacterized protein (DUF952 family)
VLARLNEGPQPQQQFTTLFVLEMMIAYLVRSECAPLSTERIYILIAVADYDAAVSSGFYRPATMDADKFIHASPPEELTRVANKYYVDKKDVRLLHIDPLLVKAEIRWEPATGGLYPHIYGPLNLDAVVRVTRIFTDSDGKIRIDPKEWAQ